MSNVMRRLRMFAGPNGSGKSSVVRRFSREYTAAGLFSLHRYINADDLLVELNTGRPVPLSRLDVSLKTDELRSAMLAGGRITAEQIERSDLRVETGRILTTAGACDSYFAAALADCLRESLLASRVSFSFETVMSHPNKVDFLRRALASGYRTYTYFVATNDPKINIHRIANRKAEGGHDVPSDKVVERYRRCLELLASALRYSTRAFIFDNSGEEPTLIAEWTPERVLTPVVPERSLPGWYAEWVKQQP